MSQATASQDIDYLCALCSYFVYESETTLRNIFAGDQAPVRFAAFHEKQPMVTFIATNQATATIVIAVRGTDDLKDAEEIDMPQGFILPVVWPYGQSVYVGKGWLTGLNLIKDEVIATLQETFQSWGLTPAQCHVYVTGHSMGSAVGTLLALYIYQTLYLSLHPTFVDLQLVGFGSPCVGEIDLTWLLASYASIGFVTRSYIAKNDNVIAWTNWYLEAPQVPIAIPYAPPPGFVPWPAADGHPMKGYLVLAQKFASTYALNPLRATDLVNRVVIVTTTGEWPVPNSLGPDTLSDVKLTLDGGRVYTLSNDAQDFTAGSVGLFVLQDLTGWNMSNFQSWGVTLQLPPKTIEHWSFDGLMIFVNGVPLVFGFNEGEELSALNSSYRAKGTTLPIVKNGDIVRVQGGLPVSNQSKYYLSGRGSTPPIPLQATTADGNLFSVRTKVLPDETVLYSFYDQQTAYYVAVGVDGEVYASSPQQGENAWFKVSLAPASPGLNRTIIVTANDDGTHWQQRSNSPLLFCTSDSVSQLSAFYLTFVVRA